MAAAIRRAQFVFVVDVATDGEQALRSAHD
jgi:hypothetical protein